MVVLCQNVFQWADSVEFNLDKYEDNSSRGWILEVDLEYCKELHELHNDYPLASEKLEIGKEMFPYYQLNIIDGYNISIGNVKKLVPNFFDKEKYLLHCKTLQR